MRSVPKENYDTIRIKRQDTRDSRHYYIEERKIIKAQKNIRDLILYFFFSVCIINKIILIACDQKFESIFHLKLIGMLIFIVTACGIKYVIPKDIFIACNNV